MTSNGAPAGSDYPRPRYSLPHPSSATDHPGSDSSRHHDSWTTSYNSSYRLPELNRPTSATAARPYEFAASHDAPYPDTPLFMPHTAQQQSASSLISPRDSHFRGNSLPLPPQALSLSPPTHTSPGDWSFPSAASITDGAPLVHIPPPHGGLHSPDHDTSLGHGPGSHSRNSQRSRKNRKPNDEPNSLDELRDPPPGEKPDYSYPVLIRCAILSHQREKPTLAEIYDMIHNRFSFFKMDDTSWKNSVRHYLSISPSFVKVPRPITEPGKGNYWTYDANPPAKSPRRRPARKRKGDRDDDEPGSFHDGGGRTKSFRSDGGQHDSPPPAASEGAGTPSSSDMGDGAHYVPSPGGGVRIASHRTNPAYPWLEPKNERHERLRQHQPEDVPIALASPRLGSKAPPAPPPTRLLFDQAPFSPHGPGVASPFAPAPPSRPTGAPSYTGVYPSPTDPTFRTPAPAFPTQGLPPLPPLDTFPGSSMDGRSGRAPRGSDDILSMPFPGAGGIGGGQYSDPTRGRAPENGDARYGGPSGGSGGW